MTLISEERQVACCNSRSVSLRTFGGRWPRWAKSFPPQIRTPSIEIVVVRDRTDIDAVMAPKETGRDDELFSILIIDKELDEFQLGNSGASWVIAAADGRLDALAEACTRVACEILRGECNLANIIDVSASLRGTTLFGRGAVIGGIYGHETRRTAKAALRKLVDAGFAGGTILAHTVASFDAGDIDLFELDEFTTDVLKTTTGGDCVEMTFCDEFAFSNWLALAFETPVLTHRDKARRRRRGVAGKTGRTTG